MAETKSKEVVLFNNIRKKRPAIPSLRVSNEDYNALWARLVLVFRLRNSNRLVEALMEANHVEFTCKQTEAYSVHLNDVERILYDLEIKLRLLGAWGLLQLRSGSSKIEIESYYRHMWILLTESWDELPTRVVNYRRALLKRVAEAYRRLSSRRQERFKFETKHQTSMRYISDEEKFKDAFEGKLMFLCRKIRKEKTDYSIEPRGYIHSQEAVADIWFRSRKLFKMQEKADFSHLYNARLGVLNSFEKWIEIEPDLIGNHLKLINSFLERELNVEALIEAEFFQKFALFRSLDCNEIELIIANIEAKLNSLGPIGWLQLKPCASQREIRNSFKNLRRILEFKTRFIDFIDDQGRCDQFKKNILKRVNSAYESLQRPERNFFHHNADRLYRFFKGS